VPVLYIFLHIFSKCRYTSSPKIFKNSAGIPSTPTAFPVFIFLIASLISSPSKSGSLLSSTKTMVVSKKDGRTISIMIDGQKVEQVKTFKYLGSVIAEDGRCMDDIKQRIGCAKDAFNKRKIGRASCRERG